MTPEQAEELIHAVGLGLALIATAVWCLFLLKLVELMKKQ